MYKIHIKNRSYTEWECMTSHDMNIIELDGIEPTKEKLLSGDVFDVNEENNVTVISSPTRKLDTIPGVLDLKSNRTYGRETSGKRRLLHRVVPDDIRLPVFLVPYEQKHMGFSKVFSNLYVTIRFQSWEGKHPYGTIMSTIGSVEVLANFYEYQLYCRSLYASIQRFNKDTTKRVRQLSESGGGMDGILENHKSFIEDRRGSEWNVFTIDPVNSVDFDDGFSIKEEKDKIVISVYIANVTLLLDAMNLWDSFSNRVATIYLPDRKRPMLPTILSDNLCSLQEQVTRFAMTMDVIIDKTTYEIQDVSYKNCVVCVSKNYRYQETELLNLPDYTLLEDTVKKLSKRYQYIRMIHNSHEVVSYMMTMMNYFCAKSLLEKREGLFRNSVFKNDNIHISEELPEEVSNFIKIWYSSGGQYINAATLEEDVSLVRHELMDMDAYIHITSPIRRLVDLLNMIKFQQLHSLVTLSSQCYDFYKKWTNTDSLEYINTSMRSIRKIQSDCSMIEYYTNNTDITDKEYDGVMFDKVVRHDDIYKYVVYLSELKLTMRVYIPNDFPNFTRKKFKIFLFHDEDTLKKKIRLQLMET